MVNQVNAVRPCRALERRQALHRSVREAADPHSCRGGINASPSPRTPHQQGGPSIGVRPGREEGRRIGFFNAGCRRELAEPVDSRACNLITRGLTKRGARFPISKPPRVAAFYPRVCLGFPRVRFRQAAVSCLSLYFFSEEREEEKPCKGEVWPSTGWKLGGIGDPRVGRAIHGFSVDQKIGKGQWWRGLTCCAACIHGSTGRSVPVLPVAGRAGGRDV